MESKEGITVMDIEHFSKCGTELIHQGCIQEAYKAFQEAYEHSQKLGKHGYMQRACAFNLGALLTSIGRFSDALHYLSLARPDDGCKDGKSNGDLFFNLGLAHEGRKNLPDSIQNFEKALIEYKSEPSNTKMKTDTTRRLGQLCVANGQFTEAEIWMKELIQIYDDQGNKESRLQAEAERANLLLRMEKAEEAESIADECLKGAKEFMSPNSANTFNELGLVYTQLSKHENALECSQLALSLLKSPSADQKLIVVLHQNIGAIYNYIGKFEEAIKHHNIAVEKHAELKNRKSQGHCFINLGYAYSQLKQFEKARESFLHALQAAKDCGDKKSEWQSYEALGSAAFTQGDQAKAHEYFKQALSSLGQSPETADKSIQERIFGKLTHIIQAQTNKSKTGRPTVEETLRRAVSDPVENKPVSNNQDGNDNQDERLITVRRGSKIKHLRVRRSGTLRQFKKIALGLDVSQPLSSRGRDNVSILSAETVSEHDIDDEDEDQGDSSPGSEKKQGKQKSVLEEDSQEDGDSDDSERERMEVHEAMSKLGSLNDENAGTSGTTGFQSKQVNADVHAQAQESSSESEDDEDDSSDEDTDDEEESEEEDKKTDTKVRHRPPPVPSLSPTATGLTSKDRTYETPKAEEVIYETIDHKARSSSSIQGKTKRSNEGERLISSLRASNDDDGLNFFHADGAWKAESHGKVLPRVEEGEQGTYKELEKAGTSSDRGGGSSKNFDDTIYERVRSPSLQGRETPGLGIQASKDNEDDIEDEDDTENGLERMSRAERDQVLYNEFQKDVKKKENQVAEANKSDTDQKNSKHCIVM